MSLVVEVDGVALPDGALTIRGAPNSGLPGGVQGLPLAAWYGEALTGGYVIDDPEGDYDFTGLHTIVAYETASSRPFITGGWITGRRVSRGIYKDGPGRVHDVDFIDINWNFALMVFRASSAKRPAETDLARAAFIQASAPMAFTPSHDNGRFNVSTNPVNFDDSDLVTKYPIEAFNEFAGVAGKNFYNYYDNAVEEISLHYDLVGVGPAAGIAISNVIADSDSSTFYPFLDAELDQGPAYKVTGILFGYRGAYAYGIRQATIDDLSPSIFSPSEFQRDEVYTTDRVGRLSTAEALIDSMLEDRAVDTDTIKVSIRVPAEKVNDCYPGEIMDVKFTHLPGYESVVQLPIIRRNVVPTAGRVDMYDIHLELSGNGAPSGPGGGDPGEFPHQPCAAGFVQIKADFDSIGNPSVTLDTAPGVGNTLIMWLFHKSTTPTLPSGFTVIKENVSYPDAIGFDRGTMLYRVVSSGDGSTYTFTNSGQSWIVVAEFSGLGSLIDMDFLHLGSGPTSGVPFSVGSVTGAGVIISLGGYGDHDPPTKSVAPVDSTELFNTATGVPWWAGGWREVAAGTHNETYMFTGGGTEDGSAGIVALFAVGGDNSCCPDAGQWVRGEVVGFGDGTSDTFTTNCPFADDSLAVYVDRLPQTAALVAAGTDGETSTFQLDFIPRTTEFIEVDYQGR